LATLGLVGLLAAPAAAAEWTVETAANQFGAGRENFRYTLNPGGRLKDGLVVVNHGASPLRLAVRAAGGVAPWVRPSRDAVTVRAGESVDVPFAIMLPEGAKPGDYVGDIAGLPIRLRVGGALRASLAVEDVRVDRGRVTYTLHNTGNAILGARQTVSVTGPFGRWAGKVGRIPNAADLLPGERRAVSVPVDGIVPAFRTTATVTLVPLLTDAAGSTAPLAATRTVGHAWTVPWSLLAGLIGLCALVVVIRRFVGPTQRNRSQFGSVH
jgi:hypothetical protein